MLVNLTPHSIVFVLPGGIGRTVPPSGQVARCTVQRTQVGTVDVAGASVPVHRSVFGAVTGLPDPVDGTIYLVSALVATAVRRPDVVMVDDAVRGGDGQIVGCRAVAMP